MKAKIKNLIGRIAYKVLLWAIDATPEEFRRGMQQLKEKYIREEIHE